MAVYRFPPATRDGIRRSFSVRVDRNIATLDWRLGEGRLKSSWRRKPPEPQASEPLFTATPPLLPVEPWLDNTKRLPTLQYDDCRMTFPSVGMLAQHYRYRHCAPASAPAAEAVGKLDPEQDEIDKNC
ncbi:430b2069-9f6a-41e4-a5ee-128a6c64e658 [Thermothielavioides terrestris]|uniref:430b2069-9f6a-41e4-a5ee-128a6c64e658 n=1 Tax=Thermothielavioides terrestris TaxID=2587410 RepID=A0A3S4F6W3_9PEZI|nr:430b2069-9f6a-41e4-a5ee-128a6c64e658 [Thermothielavioides terrestris]